MSLSRTVPSLLLRIPKTFTPIIGATHRQFINVPRPRSSLQPIVNIAACRCYSQDAKPSKIYFFEDIKSHIAEPNPDRILVDTREPGELQTTGTIPGSINVPITSKPDSFHITAEDFHDRFGFERPGKDKELVFYCKAGVRSRAAAELAKQAGWSNVGEYAGSWLDWEKNGGDREKV